MSLILNEIQKNLQQAQGFLNDKKDVDALNLLKKNYHQLKELSLEQLSQEPKEFFSMMDQSLQLIGLITRQNHEPEKAYFYHQLRFEYALHFLSAKQIHEACLDLDLDALALANRSLSVLWLEKSLGYAEQQNNPIDQSEAYAKSYDRYSAHYAVAQDFENTLKMMDHALDYWLSYESFCGPESGRVYDSYVSLGDLFLVWAMDLKKQNQLYSWHHEQSEKNYRRAYDLGITRQVDSHKIVLLKQKIEQLNNFSYQSQSVDSSSLNP